MPYEGASTIEQYRSFKAPGLDCPECHVDTGDSAHFRGCSVGERLGCATRPTPPAGNLRAVPDPPPEEG